MGCLKLPYHFPEKHHLKVVHQNFCDSDLPPITIFQPWQSPYTSMDNDPVVLTDVRGLNGEKGKKATGHRFEEVSKETWEKEKPEGATEEQYWTWVDENQVTHYWREVPPPAEPSAPADKKEAQAQAKTNNSSSEQIAKPEAVITPTPGPSKTDQAKREAAQIITQTAEKARQIYEKASAELAEHPWLTEGVNLALIPAKATVNKTITSSQNDFGWVDLFNLWFWELRDVEYNFGPEAETTKNLMKQEGVQQARRKALALIEQNKTGSFNHTWTYGQKEFYESTPATVFLGSYSVSVIVKKVNDTFMIQYEVSNTTSLESGTRFRKDNDGDGSHDGIIDSDERGNGLELGGNFKQTWTWSETIK